MKNHIINVSSRLPVSKGEDPVKSSNSLLTLMDSIADTHSIWWIGWTGSPQPSHTVCAHIKKKLRAEYQYIPVFLKDEEINAFFNGFSNSSIWPLLHYIPSQSSYDDAWYDVYMHVMERFADCVMESARDGDTVWIHDYHLMPLPLILKKRNAGLKIGFFFHTPFPSYELFRCHPRREELLNHVLGADLIGFQTFGYLRHFRSTVLRILGIESKINEIPHRGYVTKIGVFPVGVNLKKISDVVSLPQYTETLELYTQRFKERRIVLSVDNFDYSKGILHKLHVIETFLNRYPEHRDRVTFLIIAIPVREEINEYMHFTHDVAHAVGYINGKYSTVTNIPVHFIQQHLEFYDICALYTLADIALVTPLIDGMNLVAKEFIAVNNTGKGMLILSEFAGSSQELFNAVMINPYNNLQVARAIAEGLEMGVDEKRRMIEPMRERIRTNDAVFWANSFLLALDAAAEDPAIAVNIKNLDPSIAALFTKHSGKKALFLDYDGTLREFTDNPDEAVPSEQLTEIFSRFKERKDLSVFIISGRKMDFLLKHFGKYPFALIGEHGYYIRRPEAFPGTEYTTMLGEFDMSWKTEIDKIFKYFSKTTPGSSVEEKSSALVWHYRKSDPEFGLWKASALIGELTEVISNLPVAIHHGQKIVEVSSQYVNKGIAMARIINDQCFDRVLCAGDDKTDETMFKLKKDNIISVKIGEQETEADYRIASPSRFRKFLALIADN